MQHFWLEINLCKIKSLGPLPKDAILVTADVAGLYPSIPHSDGLNALKYALNKRKKHDVSTAILIDMAEFVLTNNFFDDQIIGWPKVYTDHIIMVQIWLLIQKKFKIQIQFQIQIHIQIHISTFKSTFKFLFDSSSNQGAKNQF